MGLKLCGIVDMNFGECSFPRTSVNKGKKGERKGRGVMPRPFAFLLPSTSFEL
jgi:hypothetical protein